MSEHEIEFLKSGPTSWMARSGEYTIEKTDAGYILRDGFGRQIGEPLKTLKGAKALAAATEKKLTGR